MADELDKIIDFLKSQRNIGDAKAQRVLEILEAHDKLNSLKEAKDFMKERVKAGALEHEEIGKIDSATHNALKRSFDLERRRENLTAMRAERAAGNSSLV